MKLFKKLAILCTALTLSVGLGASFAACGGNDGSSSQSSSSVNETPHAQGYDFEVTLPTGADPSDYQIQICTADNSVCLLPAPVSADGKANCYQEGMNKSLEYVVHVMKNGKQLDKTAFQVSLTTIPANYTGNVIKVIVNE